MKTWDRVAWVSSWVAPISLAVCLGSLALAMTADGGVRWFGGRNTFAGLALVCGSLGLLAHLLVVYRVHRILRSPKLATLLQFGVGYTEARRRFESRNERGLPK